MREIKFRAWNKHHKRMYRVYSICFDTDTVGAQDIEKRTTHTFGFIDLDIQQFTGLKDKNGKDIYEGDIVRTKAKFGTSGKHPKKTGEYIETVAQVLFTEDGAFTYREPDWQYRKRIDLGNSTDWYRSYCWLKECEVIGNIHENPELMEQSS